MKKQTAIIFMLLTFIIGCAFGIYISSTPKVEITFKNKVTNNAHKNCNEELKNLIEQTEKFPKNKTVWINLGNFYFDHDESNKAIKAYETAIKLEPDNANVLMDMGIMYRRNGQSKKPSNYLIKLLK